MLPVKCAIRRGVHEDDRILETNKAGQVKSVGRVIRKGKGCNGLFVGVTPTYLESNFAESC